MKELLLPTVIVLSVQSKIYAFFLTLAVCCSFNLLADLKEPAFISVPVADLTIDPYYRSSKSISIDDHYHKIPFSGSWKACKRAHQLLFNETVTVLEERGPEVKVKISNFYFLKANQSTPIDTYWTLKKNLTYFSDVKPKKSALKKIPTSISYKENNIEERAPEKTITLKKPFYDPITKEIYSVGTRFTLSSDETAKGPYDKGSFDAYIYDSQSKKIKTTKVPKINCVRNYSKKPKDKIQNFVQVLRLWAYQKDGAIPYVLGGWSWTVTCNNDDFEILQESETEYSIHRKKWKHSSKSGFDCMGIIGRAAQVCDIPFYIKNTTTLLKDLKALEKSDQVSEGDMIWYPGHVMVVSSVKKGLVIEAVGYERGDGKVEEHSIEKVFQDVHSFEELKNRVLEKKATTVICYDGKKWGTYKNIKILKINSIFPKN